MTHQETASEYNFDGLVGPTHHYGGLGAGNLASRRHGGQIANPRQAALEGLKKMRLLHEMGMPQALLPPHERPHMAALRACGLEGTDAQVLEKAWQRDPTRLESCCSAAAMWTANAATVSPGPDCADGRPHLSVANLASQFHRSLEAPQTHRTLQHILDPAVFALHPPLAGDGLADEGAANHMRLCPAHGQPGIEIFAYGRTKAQQTTGRFLPRQTLEASRAVAAQHGISPQRLVFAQQHEAAVEAGVFHNDVIATANENVLLIHQQAFAAQDRVLDEVGAQYAALQAASPLCLIQVPAARIPLQQAVTSYLFNSQLLSRKEGGMLLLVPRQCRTQAAVSDYLDELLADATNPIVQVRDIDLQQSMRNGGGPACLRLRLVATADQAAAIHPGVLLNRRRIEALEKWIRRHYRDRLHPSDLKDPMLLTESRRALDELTNLLDLGSIYPFQDTL